MDDHEEAERRIEEWRFIAERKQRRIEELEAEANLSLARRDCLQQFDAILSDAGFSNGGDLTRPATERLRSAMREMKAWRALAEWESKCECHSVVFEMRRSNGLYMIDATDHEPITGDTPQACAIALAERLGLI